jgi:hypothetical protein
MSHAKVYLSDFHPDPPNLKMVMECWIVKVQTLSLHRNCLCNYLPPDPPNAPEFKVVMECWFVKV